MSDGELFAGQSGDETTGGKKGGRGPSGGALRLKRADRDQREVVFGNLDDLVPADHLVRSVWKAVEGLDLSDFYADVESREGVPGQPRTDPKVLLCLWLFATSEGVCSARRLARLCERDRVYQWILGGVTTNYHTLSDFRGTNRAKLDALLTKLIAGLMHAGVVEAKRTAQDGMKVRASAGSASFRRRPSLEECLKNAEEAVARTRTPTEEAEEEKRASDRKAAAERRAAEDVKKRADAALEAIKHIEARQKAEREKRPTKPARTEPRASTTDADARVMIMADRGARPAYNVQLATDVDSGYVLGAFVSTQKNDMNLTRKMFDELKERTGRLPEAHLVDGGFTTMEAVDDAAKRKVALYAPPKRTTKKGVDPAAPQPRDSKDVIEWRRRMATPEAKEIYKLRASTAERTNADLRAHRGLDRLNVRGLDKVLSVTLLAVLTFDVLRWISAGLPSLAG